MMRSTKITGLMLASGFATLGLLQPAWALDAEAFVDRVESVYESMGYDFDFGPATANGNVITVNGGSLSIAGVEDDMTFDTTLTFTGVAETADGGFTAETLTVPDIEFEFGGKSTGHFSLANVRVEGIVLPPAGVKGTVALMETMRTLSAGPLEVARNGEKVIAIDKMDMSSEFTHDAAGTLQNIVTTTQVDGIWADLSTVKEEDANAGAVIEALGLTNIDGSFSQSMSWSMSDGRIVIDKSLFDFTDLGALDVKFDILGFTPAVMDKIYAMQDHDLDPESEEAQAKQMMLGMELAQALSIASASIRYDDASFAGKLLDMFAAQSGADRATFAEGLKSMLPAMVGQSGIPALKDLVVPPVTAFLDNPQSIEVSVQPPQPTSLLVLTAAAANPAGLLKAIGLAVTANQ